MVLGYYVLEIGRHAYKQYTKWDSEDNALPLGYRLMLWLLIAATCIFWPVMYVRGKMCHGNM